MKNIIITTAIVLLMLNILALTRNSMEYIREKRQMQFWANEILDTMETYISINKVEKSNEECEQVARDVALKLIRTNDKHFVNSNIIKIAFKDNKVTVKIISIKDTYGNLTVKLIRNLR